MKLTRNERCVHTLALCLVWTLVAAVVIPLLHILAVALSSEFPVTRGTVFVWPREFQLRAFAYVFESSQFRLAIKNSAVLTILGTLAGMVFSTTAAYALSHTRLPGRKWLLLVYVFTMLFNGGMIPTFLLVMNLSLLNTYWSIVLVNCISVYNMLILKNYFEALPEEIEESAKIDGAKQVRIFLEIALPLSKPVLATVTLFFAVQYWNEYFSARLYMTKPSMIVLQSYLRAVIFESTDPSGAYTFDTSKLGGISPKTIVNATVLAAAAPICILYPFLQKYFVSGVILGSVKG